MNRRQVLAAMLVLTAFLVWRGKLAV